MEELLEIIDVDVLDVDVWDGDGDGVGVIAVVLVLLLDGVTLGVMVTVRLSVGVIEIVVAPDEKKDKLLLDSMIVAVAVGNGTVVVFSLPSK